MPDSSSNAAGPVPWLFRIVPALDSLRHYSGHIARADFLAGLTVAAVALPQAMAYAMVAGLPVEYGLYTAIVMTAVGAVFDSSRQLINGPTNAISIAVLSALGPIAADEKVQVAILLAFLVGVIQLAITALRLGDLTRYISHSVIVGFTAGAGTLLVLDQIKNLVGLTPMGDAHDHFLVRFGRTFVEGGPIHPATAAVGFGSIGLVLGIRWLKNRLGWTLVPELLLVVIAMAVVVGFLHLDDAGVRVVGTIPAKLPSFEVPMVDASHVRLVWTDAAAIAVLGLLEAVAMAKAIAAQTRQKLDINQQCLSEGVANLSGSFFQCFPGSGSLTRSSINQQAGGVTQWSGVIAAGAVALTVILFAPWARFVPKAALAGILIVSAWRMVDKEALAYHLRATRFDAIIVLATAISAVAVSVEFCVLIGVFASVLLTVPRAGRMLLTEFVVTRERQIHERIDDELTCSKVLIFGLEGEMFFGSGAILEEHLAGIDARATDGIEIVVLRLKRVRSPDAVCLHMLATFIEHLEARGVHVVLCGVREDLFQALRATGLLRRLGGEQVFTEQKVRFTSTQQAVRHAYDRVGDHVCPVCGPRTADDSTDERLYFVV